MAATRGAQFVAVRVVPVAAGVDCVPLDAEGTVVVVVDFAAIRLARRLLTRASLVGLGPAAAAVAVVLARLGSIVELMEIKGGRTFVVSSKLARNAVTAADVTGMFALGNVPIVTRSMRLSKADLMKVRVLMRP